MSTLQRPELHLDVSTLKRPVLDMSTLQRDVLHLHMDVSTPQRPELHLGLSIHCRGLPFFWRCLHFRGLSSIWTCLRYRSLCCTWTCLHHKRPELHLDLSTLQRAVQLLEVSTLRGLSCLWTSSVACAGPGQHKGDQQQHSPEHLLWNLAECAQKKIYAGWAGAKKGLRRLSVR